MPVNPLPAFAWNELVLRFELPAGDTGAVSVRASIGRSGRFTAPESVELSDWKAADVDVAIAIGDMLCPRHSTIHERIVKELATAKNDARWLRLVLEFPQPGVHPSATWNRLMAVPWERIKIKTDDGNTQTLVWNSDPRVSIVRALADVGALFESQRTTPGLVAAPHRPRCLHLDIDSEERTDLAAESVELDADRVDATTVQVGSARDLSRLLAAEESGLSALHLTAHGEEKGIAIKDHLVSPDDLRDKLAGPKLDLLLLSVCHSAKPGWIASILPELLPPVFIGMQQEIRGAANADFVRTLFGWLAMGAAIDEAVREARAAVIGVGTEAMPSWYVPVLYLSAESRRNPVLWPMADYANEMTFNSVNGVGGRKTDSNQASPDSSGGLPGAVATDGVIPEPLLSVQLPRQNEFVPVELGLLSLPTPLEVFDVHAGSCFLASPSGVIEIYPDTRGLFARRLRHGDEMNWSDGNPVRAVSLDPSGRFVACTSGSGLAFSQIRSSVVLPSYWVPVQDLIGDVNEIHEVIGRRSGYEAVVTLGGQPHRVTVDSGGICAVVLLGAEWLTRRHRQTTDSAGDLEVSLTSSDLCQIVEVRYQGEVRQFRAPDGATDVHAVRLGDNKIQKPGIIIRCGDHAGLWEAPALLTSSVLA